MYTTSNPSVYILFRSCTASRCRSSCGRLILAHPLALNPVQRRKPAPLLSSYSLCAEFQHTGQFCRSLRLRQDPLRNSREYINFPLFTAPFARVALPRVLRAALTIGHINVSLHLSLLFYDSRVDL